MIYRFLSNNPSSGDISSSNLCCSYRRQLKHYFDMYQVWSTVGSSTQAWSHIFRELDHEIISMVIFPLCADSRRLSLLLVEREGMC